MVYRFWNLDRFARFVAAQSLKYILVVQIICLANRRPPNERDQSCIALESTHVENSVLQRRADFRPGIPKRHVANSLQVFRSMVHRFRNLDRFAWFAAAQPLNYMVPLHCWRIGVYRMNVLTVA